MHDEWIIENDEGTLAENGWTTKEAAEKFIAEAFDPEDGAVAVMRSDSIDYADEDEEDEA